MKFVRTCASTLILSVMITGCSGGGSDSPSIPAVGGQPSTPPPASPPPPPPPPPATPQSVTFSGETELWHPITLTLDGPSAEEDGATNPFTDFALNVTFSQGSQSYTAPGYFAACGNAAETSCTGGDQWRVHFTPNTVGNWDYAISFREGANVALNGGGTAVADLDGLSGSFSIGSSTKTGNDFRASDKGRLSYQGGHYLQFENGDPFFKVGADSPENTLAYEDFDATPNRGDRRKDWWPHLDDFSSATGADAFLWQDTKGQELLGAWSYLADQGVNAVSFLTFSLGGDDENIFPHLLRVSLTEYDGLGRNAQWNQGVHHDRFDVSKLDQWDRVFSYADQLGLFLHFKTMETENDELMDDGAFGPERQLYYRELVARFGHHLALNWNLGEEYTLSTETARQTLTYLDEIDPYGHLRVLHTYPGQWDQHYGPLLGNQSALTGASVQTGNQNFNEVRSTLTEWVSRSRDQGKAWVVALDEPGSASRGVAADSAYPAGQLPQSRNQSDNREAVRRRVLWNTLTAGGAGVEYYYGYQTGCDDLTCQDHETRQSKWNDAANAAAFFNAHIGRSALTMVESDSLLTTQGESQSATNVGVYSLPSNPTTFAIEAEDIGPNPPGDWVFENDKPGYTGTGYYRWAGPDIFNINRAGSGTMGYVVDIPASAAGIYRFAFRARRISRNDGRTDLNNDIWMRVIEESSGEQVQPDGEAGQTWWKMFFSGSLTDWVWSNNLDRQDGSKLPAIYNLSAGRHRIEISGRSTEFHFDRMTLNKGSSRSTNESNATTADGSVGGTGSGVSPGASDNDNYLLADPGQIYVGYLVDQADEQVLDLTGQTGAYSVSWYNPLEGGALQNGSVTEIMGGDYRAMGTPPSQPNSDWVVLIQRN
ncbi:MAG: DUF5060 domain-containing protein [Pseudomonadota bacterium]